MEWGDSGLHNLVAKAHVATVTGTAWAWDRSCQIPYTPEDSQAGDWWRGTEWGAGMQSHSACWEASARQSARVSIQ